MNIAIFARDPNEPNRAVLGTLAELIQQRGGSLMLFQEFADKLSKQGDDVSAFNTFSTHKELIEKVDCLFSIGGDGTLLNTVTLVKDSGVPVLGINTGRLGFLSSIQKDELAYALEQIERKNYQLDKRSLLSLSTGDYPFNIQSFAMNEFTVLKNDTSSMITIQVALNDHYLNTYWADGLIVATPTGSTAYSLSCGGPIVMPGSGNFTLTPIATHNLNVRPIVIPDTSKITLSIDGRSDSYLITMDSQSEPITKGINIELQKADFTINLLRIGDFSFFNTLRNKLNWGLDKRN